jgi:hypothetical protein
MALAYLNIQIGELHLHRPDINGRGADKMRRMHIDDFNAINPFDLQKRKCDLDYFVSLVAATVTLDVAKTIVLSGFEHLTLPLNRAQTRDGTTKRYQRRAAPNHRSPKEAFNG